MLVILSKLSILFIKYISRDLDNIKILLYKIFVRYLVVKPACVNAAYESLAVVIRFTTVGYTSYVQSNNFE